jgi:hypothetical protein
VITDPSSHTRAPRPSSRTAKGTFGSVRHDGPQRYKLAQVTSYTAEDGLSDEEFLVIAGDGGRIMVGEPKFFHFSDGRLLTSPTFHPARRYRILGVALDRHGTFGPVVMGLHEFPANGHGRPITYQLNANNGLSGSPLTATTRPSGPALDSNGSDAVWAAYIFGTASRRPSQRPGSDLNGCASSPRTGRGALAGRRQWHEPLPGEARSPTPQRPRAPTTTRATSTRRRRDILDRHYGGGLKPLGMGGSLTSPPKRDCLRTSSPASSKTITAILDELQSWHLSPRKI